MRITKAVRPRAILYKINCGLSRIELIINAASQSSSIPLSEKDAARGIVPYIHRGEAMPKALAAKTPKTPSRLPCNERNRPWICSFTKTEIADPSTMPNTQ